MGKACAIRLATVLPSVLCLALAVGACSSGPSGTTLIPATATSPASTPVEAAPDRRTLLVDSDVAADDLVALAFLLASPQVTVTAITVSGTGEAHCTGGVDVVLRLLDTLDAPDIPVACGRETPLAGRHAFPSAWRERADRGSGLDLSATTRQPPASTAVELIAQRTSQQPGLTILTLGPLTNLGDALLVEPALAGRLGPVFVMGGALHVGGNLVGPDAPAGNTVAEWNVYVDPHAAQVVVASGVEPSFVSLDGTSQVPITPEFAQQAMDPGGNPAAHVLSDLFAANPWMTDGSYFLWDPLAAELSAGYPAGAFSPACIVVEEAEGPESGFTRPGCDGTNIQYLSAVDAAAAKATLLRVVNGG
jgi:inosine-uridine nucleoside N-ribohydrolase